MNNEKYSDPTADIAVGNAHKKQMHQKYDDRVSMVIHICRCVATLAGLEICTRITLRDKRTGKEYD